MQEDAFQLLISMSKDIEQECKELYELAIEQTQATEEDILLQTNKQNNHSLYLFD